MSGGPLKRGRIARQSPGRSRRWTGRANGGTAERAAGARRPVDVVCTCAYLPGLGVDSAECVMHGEPT